MTTKLIATVVVAGALLGAMAPASAQDGRASFPSNVTSQDFAGHPNWNDRAQVPGWNDRAQARGRNGRAQARGWNDRAQVVQPNGTFREDLGEYSGYIPGSRQGAQEPR